MNLFYLARSSTGIVEEWIAIPDDMRPKSVDIGLYSKDGAARCSGYIDFAGAPVMYDDYVWTAFALYGQASGAIAPGGYIDHASSVYLIERYKYYRVRITELYGMGAMIDVWLTLVGDTVCRTI